MRILVTGAAGFMASWIAEWLVREGHTVCGVDDLSGGEMENVNYWWGKPDTSFVKLDLRDVAEVAKLFDSFKPELVYHLAAHPHEGLGQFNPYDIFTTNAVASINVFTQSILHGVRRVVHFSSMARYGNGVPGPIPFGEDTHVRAPVDVYGGAKAASEVALEALSEAHGLDYCIIVPRNVSGPRQSRIDPCRNVLMIWINQCLRGKDIYIYGDGEQTRTFSHIADSLSCYIAAGFEYCASRQIINIGSTHLVTINEAAAEVLKHFPGRTVIHVDPRPCEVKHAYCTTEKSERLLGFKHTKDLPELVADMVTWATRVGPKEPRYPTMEITKNAPRTWTNRLI